MELNNDTLHFIRTHRRDDVRSLALQAQKFTDVDVPAALTQIAGWQAAAEKIPSWQAVEGVLYPPHLSLEQCSSEATARYKAAIVAGIARKGQADGAAALTETIGRESNTGAAACPGTLTDLTGGFGIDCAFLSAHFREATYVERQESLCEIAAHNFPLLGLHHIGVKHEDAIRHLQEMPPADWIFIDPARRDGHGGKTIAIADCEPNVAELEPLLLAKAGHVLLKLSPMLDLTLAVQDLKQVQEAHIVSVGNECKELLLVLGHEAVSADNIPIHCVNLPMKAADAAQPPVKAFTFTRSRESASACRYADAPCRYLYEPNASILKAGAFRQIAFVYKLNKLHPNSHLYTSDELIEGFPGRSFRITGICSLNKKEIKATLGDIRKANLTVRNFPASVAELRKRIKLAEGGDVYLFATTLANEQKVLIRCEKTA